MNSLDFIAKSQQEKQEELESLCCCQYIDKDQNKFHILGCCCNCEYFDLVFTNFITCRRSETVIKQKMLLTFQDRLRIPWKGGAKQISFESIAPIIAIPLLIGLACINLHTFILCFGLCGGLVFYFLSQVRKHNIRSRFFFMWLFFSIIYIVVLFQLTVPLLELLPEENLILVLLTTATVFCMVRTKQLSYANHLYQSSAAVDDDELPDITEATEAEEREESQTALLLDMGDDCNNQPNICSICRKYMPAYTEHCNTCGVCIRRCDHHSFWFDCCIGQWNHRYYLASLILGLLSLLLGANLTLTAICHPFLVIRVLSIPVLLPDDCSEVFEDYQLGISFVIAAYALLIAAYVFIIAIGRQLYKLFCGNAFCGVRTKKAWSNWRSFLF